jgi:hypothetical protein
MPFYRALVDFQTGAVGQSFRGQLIRTNAWGMLMDRLHTIHAKGRSLVHPKIVKLMEVWNPTGAVCLCSALDCCVPPRSPWRLVC